MFVINFPCFSCLFWFLILICNWKKNYRSQNIFAVNMLFMAISAYIWGSYIQGLNNYTTYYQFDTIDAFTTLSIHPLTYLFFKSFTDERPLKWFHYIVFLPALIVGTSTAMLYLIMGNESATRSIQSLILHNEHLAPQFDHGIYKIHYFINVKIYDCILILQIIFLISYAIKALFKYHKRLKDFFSNPDDKSMGRSKTILICFMLSLLFSLAIFLTGRNTLIEYYKTLFSPLSILWGGILNYLGFQVATLNYTADKLAADLNSTDLEAEEQGYSTDEFMNSKDNGNRNTEAKRKTSPELIEMFNQLINVQHIFTQKDLRIDDVARAMRTNRTYISRMLNEEFHSTFSDYINLKRVEFAQKLILSNKVMSQEEVSHLSGFSHPSTFSRTFKQHTGTTFREWQKNAK